MKKTFSQIGKTEPQKQTVAKDTSEGIQLIGIFGFPTAKTASVAAGYLLNTAALKSGISCLHFLLWPSSFDVQTWESKWQVSAVAESSDSSW